LLLTIIVDAHFLVNDPSSAGLELAFEAEVGTSARYPNRATTSAREANALTTHEKSWWPQCFETHSAAGTAGVIADDELVFMLHCFVDVSLQKRPAGVGIVAWSGSIASPRRSAQ
jgi:hypothetical protein